MTWLADNPAFQGERKRWIALIVVCMAMLMNVLDASIVNVALPKIQGSLHFSQANLTWVINAYLIAYGGFLLLAGRLGDLIGRKRVFLAGIALFTVASIACGLADSQVLLIVARFVQGFGAAVSSSVIIAIIITEFPKPAERAKAMSAYILVAVGGGSLGLLAGGVLTEATSWHWIFFINVPIGLIALVLGKALIDESEALGFGDRVDVLGSVLVTASLMVGIYAIVKVTEYGWISAHTLGLGAVTAALIAAFVVVESRVSNPIIPLRIFAVRSLIASSAVRAFVVIGMFSSFFLGALYFEHVRGFGALDTGLAFMPMTVVVAILSSGLTARLVTRFGAKQVLVPGLVAMFAGLLLISRLNVDSSYFPTAFFGFAIMGVGAGTSFMPLLTIAMTEVPDQDAGLGSGIVNVSMQASAALGVAILGTIATNRSTTLVKHGESTAQALVGGYHLAFVVASGCVVVGILVALFVLRSPEAATAAAAAPARQPARDDAQLALEDA
jgi:EmrB/QacA subfamily drug resistance transporter